MAFAGLDVGTSGSKMLVYDLNGRILLKVSRRYEETGTGGHRELDPAMVLSRVEEILREVGDTCPEPIEAMAVTSLGESVVCLDEKGKPLYPSMLTGDMRGVPETKELIEKAGRERIFRTTGLPPNELYGLPKYMWLNRNTDAIRKAAAIFYYEDFIGYMLTGERKVSFSSAARSLAFDIRSEKWDEELLSYAGIRLEQMSEPVKPCTVIGRIRPEVAKRLHLNPEMEVVAGGHDQTCAALGSGLIRPEDGECGMGTCEFLFAMLPEAMMTSYMADNDFTCIPYVVPGTFLTSLEITTCGALKNWASDRIFRDLKEKLESRGESFYEYMDGKAKDLRTEVLVLPQFGSSGNPDLSMDKRGTIAGLTIHTRPEEIWLAILEGLGFQMYLSYERLLKTGVRMNRMVLTGGGAASRLTCQLRADIFNMNVCTLQSEESGNMGCMLMAATAKGAYPSLEEGIRRAVKIEREYRPNEEMHQYYMQKFERYRKLYELMHEFM